MLCSCQILLLQSLPAFLHSYSSIDGMFAKFLKQASMYQITSGVSVLLLFILAAKVSCVLGMLCGLLENFLLVKMFTSWIAKFGRVSGAWPSLTMFPPALSCAEYNADRLSPPATCQVNQPYVATTVLKNRAPAVFYQNPPIT
jgi:hypothetical protein